METIPVTKDTHTTSKKQYIILLDNEPICYLQGDDRSEMFEKVDELIPLLINPYHTRYFLDIEHHEEDTFYKVTIKGVERNSITRHQTVLNTLKIQIVESVDTYITSRIALLGERQPQEGEAQIRHYSH